MRNEEMEMVLDAATVKAVKESLWNAVYREVEVEGKDAPDAAERAAFSRGAYQVASMILGKKEAIRIAEDAAECARK